MHPTRKRKTEHYPLCRSKDYEERQPERVECAESALGQREQVEFSEIPHEEAKSAAVELVRAVFEDKNSRLNSEASIREKEYTPVPDTIVEDKPINNNEESPVIEEQPFLLLDDTPQIEDSNVFNLDNIKQTHPSVEPASYADIKNATSIHALETEAELSNLDFNEYDGRISKDNYELPPVFFRESGDYYHGNWNSEGKFDGKGSLVKNDGSKLEGIWNDGELEWGRIYYKDGSHYQGQVHAYLPHGSGELNTKDTKVIKGNFEKGELTFGTIQYENTLYQGEVLNGVPHGKGEYNDTHYSYSGEWARGKRVNGRYTYPDGTIYQGEYIENIPSNGKFIWTNESSYEGDLQGFSGVHEGVYEHPSGVYTGQWSGNVFNGKGTYTWKNQNNNNYEGEYKQGKKEGKGVYYVNNSDTFKGNWKLGKADGDFEYATNGRIIKSRWRKGNLLGILSPQPGDDDLLKFEVEEEVNNISSLPYLPKIDEAKTELNKRLSAAETVLVNAIPNTN